MSTHRMQDGSEFKVKNPTKKSTNEMIRELQEDDRVRSAIRTKSEPGTAEFNLEIAEALQPLIDKVDGVDSDGMRLLEEAQGYFESLGNEIADV